MLAKFKLKMSVKKTETADFKSGLLVSTKPIQYLGFTFDGTSTLIRPSSLDAYLGKMRRGIHAKLVAAKAKNVPSFEVYQRELRSRYTHAGKTRKTIMDVLDTEAQLRSKKELIERFIAEHFANMPTSADVGSEFDSYWEAQKQSALVTLSEDEGLKREALDKVLADYLFTLKTPMRDDVIGIMEKRPALRERRSVADRVIEKIKAFVETFVEGVD